MAKTSPLITTDEAGVLTASYGSAVYHFREPLGSDLVRLERLLKTQDDQENAETDAEMLSFVLGILGMDDMSPEDYLKLPLRLYKALGLEVMASFRD